MKSVFIHSTRLVGENLNFYQNPEPFIRALEAFAHALQPSQLVQNSGYKYLMNADPENGWCPPTEYYVFQSQSDIAKLEVNFTKTFIHEPIGDSFIPECSDIKFLFSQGTEMKFDGRFCPGTPNKMSIFMSANEDWLALQGQGWLEAVPTHYHESFQGLI